MLESYQRSLAQIAAAQFRGKGFAGADQKVVTLLSRGALQVGSPWGDVSAVRLHTCPVAGMQVAHPARAAG